jgi:3-oxoacyl-[acyl-carrier-protein] synthase-3
VRTVVESAGNTLERAGLTPADVDWFIPHQANARIIEAASSRLGVARDRTIVNIDRYGNTSAASIPLAMAEAADDGRLREGDLVLMSGFGAGMTWGSALLRWGRA